MERVSCLNYCSKFLKKFLAALLSVIIVFILFSCQNGNNNGGSPNDTPKPEETYAYVSMLTDKTYKNGFIIRGLGNPIYNDPIETFGNMYDPNVKFQYDKTGLPAPEWNLCQWATRYPFHDIENQSPYLVEGQKNYEFEKLSEGVYKYTNPSKYITVDTNTGEYRLGLKASECFKYPRTQGQEWPHWFTEKRIYNVANPPNQTSIAKSQSVKVQFDIRLNSFEDFMGNDANPDLHSAICVFYLFVANRDPVSTMFTDMLWFGLSVFDNRFVLSPEQSFPDVGSKGSATEKWIFNMAASEFFTPEYNLKTAQNQVILGEWRTVNVEVLGLIHKAFGEAQRNGYMKNSKLENLYINGMYFGYETPGTYDIDMSYKNVDIVSYIKTN
ncbi:MAG: hypothetical protein PHE12_01410 [Clostridia bacterium]|nr:hypothetical protein [Clostridia bacterium]